MKRREDELAQVEKTIRKCALGYPEAYEEFPWGECAFKVKKKVFLFMGSGKSGLSLSMKLPASGAAALLLLLPGVRGRGFAQLTFESLEAQTSRRVEIQRILGR